MIEKESVRRIEVLQGGDWIECRMSQIEQGDVFRMFESTGEPVLGPGGEPRFKALGPASIQVDMIAITPEAEL